MSDIELTERFTEAPGHAIHFDRQSRPITADEWCELITDRKYKIVKQTQVGPWLVSTVWLGLDHGSPGRVLIFETMVFDESHGVIEEDDIGTDRYSTEAEALEGHARTIEAATRAQAKATQMTPSVEK